MKPMSEQEFLSRLGPTQATDTLGELLSEFLCSHGFIDAGRETARLLDRTDYDERWFGGDAYEDADGPTVFEAGAEGAP